MSSQSRLIGVRILVGGLFLLGCGAAHAQIGIMNQMLDHAMQMQRQQQYNENQRRGAERARKDEQNRQSADKKAEEKRAAADAAARRREEALAKVAPPAEQLIAEVSDFLKANPTHPGVLQFAEGLSALSRVLKAGDPAAVEKQTAVLSRQMQKDPAFTQFALQRAEARREENARGLVEALEVARGQKSFLISQIAQNPTAASSEGFLGLVKSLDQALVQPTLETLKPLTAQAEVAIRQAGLRNAYLAMLTSPQSAGAPAAAVAGGALQAAAGPAEPSKDTARLTNALTEKNRFLMDGDVNDVVFVFNTSSGAPHVLRNLKGDIVFEKKRASVCLFQRDVDVSSVNLARRAMAQFELETIVIDSAPCSADRLRTYDVVVVRRAAVFREDQAYVLALLKQVELGAYASLLTLSASDMAGRDESAARRAVEVEQQSRQGFGLLILTNTSAMVCAVVADQREAHQRALLDMKQLVSAEISGPPKLSFTSLDTAFAGIKREQCAAIYAAPADLKSLTTALKRDATPFQISALWVDPEQLARIEETLAAEKAQAQKLEFEQRRNSQELSAVAALRAADEAKTKDAIRSALRAKNGRQAEAAATLIGNEIKAGVDGRTSDAKSQYADFFLWLDDRRKDRWEVFSLNTSLYDYGTAVWKDRPLEAAAVRIDIRLRNQYMGEYRDYCYVFAKIFDAEFQMQRDPVFFPCENQGVFAKWKTTRSFASLWNVE